MGMYTSILHPDDGRELQIKTGEDDCDTYRLGDTVNFRVSQYIAECGGIFDGVYDSYSDKGPDDWVVVKDRKIAAIEPREKEYQQIVAQYGIEPPDSSLWSEEAWERRREIAKQSDEEFRAADADADAKGLSGADKVGYIMSQVFVRNKLNKESVLRKILYVDPYIP